MAGAAQLTNVFDSYDAVGIREELSDLIADISPTDTPFLSNIGSESTGNTFFEWQTDVLDTAAQNHQVDGFDITTYDAVTPTVRLGNYTSILEKDFMISGTEEAVNKAGRSSELAYQATKAAKALKRDQEVNLTANNAAVAGSGPSTARETGGLEAWLKTNVNLSNTEAGNPDWETVPTDARSDGTTRAFTETILKDVMKQAFDNGGEPSILMVGSFNKQATSAFAGIAEQRYMAPTAPTTIIGAADVYLSDFGELMVVPNRFSRDRSAFFIDPDMARRRILRPYQIQEMAKTGDAEKRMILIEEGLQVDNEAGHGIAADLTTT